MRHLLGSITPASVEVKKTIACDVARHEHQAQNNLQRSRQAAGIEQRKDVVFKKVGPIARFARHTPEPDFQRSQRTDPPLQFHECPPADRRNMNPSHPFPL